jgi:dTDP-4-dehydrorhamnose reductase
VARQFAGASGVEVLRLDRSRLNLGDPLLVERVLGPLDFDWLINAAAFTKVDDCESQSDHAYLINGHAPGQLARLCMTKRARLIHFSTDYVFDGRSDRPYRETDEPNPLSVYGRSKLIGEREVLAADPAHLVLRLSWMFGPGRPGFPEWVLRQAATGGVRVVDDKRGCPTYSLDVASWVQWLVMGGTAPGGVLHLCNPPACSWFEFASEVLRLAGVSARLVPIPMADLAGLPAPRPDSSALDPTAFESLSGLRCRPWQEALAEHLGGKG